MMMMEMTMMVMLEVCRDLSKRSPTMRPSTPWSPVLKLMLALTALMVSLCDSSLLSLKTVEGACGEKYHREVVDLGMGYALRCEQTLACQHFKLNLSHPTVTSARVNMRASNWYPAIRKLSESLLLLLLLLLLLMVVVDCC